MTPPSRFLITPLSRETIARLVITPLRVSPAKVSATRNASPFSGIVRFVVTALTMLTVMTACGQNVGDFIITEKTASTGRVTNRTWPKGASTLWGTNSSSLPAKITVGSGLTLSGSPLTLTATGGGSGGATLLDELTDVTITSAATGQVLRYNGTAWVNYTHGFLTSSDLTGYLTTSTAASTYATISNLALKAPLASPTFTGTVTIPSGASISGYATTAAVASSYQPLDAQLTAFSLLDPSSGGGLVYFNGTSGLMAISTLTSAGRQLLDDDTFGVMRSTLGLGSMATQSAESVYISGGLISGVIYDVAAGFVLMNDIGEYPDSPTTTLTTANLTNVTLQLPTSGSYLLSDTSAATTTTKGAVELATDGETSASVVVQGNDGRLAAARKVEIGLAISDEITALTTGTAKLTFRMPHALTLTAVRMSLTTVSSSGTPTVDINESGTTILSTKLTCDASEKTSTTAATAAVISDTALADDAEITVDIDTAGTGATGAKVWLIGTRN